MTAPARSSGRSRLAAIGVAGVLLLTGTAGAVIHYGAGGFRTDPTFTLTVPASAGPIQRNSVVQYRGLVVGTVTEVRAGARGSTVTLRLAADKLRSVPVSVTARVLPRTLFGDRYVNLSVPEGREHGRALQPGDPITHNDNAPTATLYRAASRLYELVDAVRPAELNAALGAIAGALRGNGAEIGRMIDRAAALTGESGLPVDELLGALPDISRLTGKLADAAPDAVAALDNAVHFSEIIAHRKSSIRKLITAGIEGTGITSTLIRENSDRAIHLVRNSGRLLDTVRRHPGALRSTVSNLDELLGAVNRAFAHGPWVAIKAPVTLDDPHPYTARDCPRYGELTGPNCPDGTGNRRARGTPGAPGNSGAPDSSGTDGTPESGDRPDDAGEISGGTVGPVGSKQEKSTLTEILPGTTSPDLRSLLFGPLLRGNKVVTGR